MKDTTKLFTSVAADAILVVSEKNRLYFTEFASTFGYLVILPSKCVFFTDPRYYEMACAIQSDKLQVVCTQGAKAYEQIVDLLKTEGVKTVGFEDTELTVADFNVMQQNLSAFKLVEAGKAISLIRSVKTNEEIDCIKRAQAITDRAFSQILKFIKPGMTEIEVAIELEYYMRKLGATGLAFDTIVASGVNTSKPHAHPTNKKIELGDAVTIDFGAAYNGYCSDMTRTFFVGEPKKEMVDIYNIVLLAQRNAIQNAYCDMTGRELDSYAREIIVANGHGQHFTHSTGHSLGIDIHEFPSASANSQDVLGHNQLITVEPGIYIPGLGGVRIEDLLLITKDGVIDLTTSNKNIIII
ncbi:MAG: aminopeptidase P family protein [Clostridia bacterium]|nr:aminopeptidase P family protein [Clostridia bacterium]